MGYFGKVIRKLVEFDRTIQILSISPAVNGTDHTGHHYGKRAVFLHPLGSQAIESTFAILTAYGGYAFVGFFLFDLFAVYIQKGTVIG